MWMGIKMKFLRFVPCLLMLSACNAGLGGDPDCGFWDTCEGDSAQCSLYGECPEAPSASKSNVWGSGASDAPKSSGKDIWGNGGDTESSKSSKDIWGNGGKSDSPKSSGKDIWGNGGGD